MVFVKVTLSDGSFVVQSFDVRISDVNEAPLFVSAGSASDYENDSAVIATAATDPDANTILTYSIIGGADSALFQISAAGGLSFRAAPNFETPGDAGGDNIYDVIVQASDGSLTASQSIAVTVTNVNEAPSSTSGAAVSVGENTTAVQTVLAGDPEGTALSYSLAGADAALFQISAAGALS
ncbi:MAG: hypothetical protein CFE32_22655, partial [Alphaproteobacteria bacterium PA3]